MDEAPAAIGLHGAAMTFTGRAGPVEALRPTDLSVRAGEFLVLIGPSGCGKTTLLRLMAGLVRPSAGAVRVAGEELWRDGKRNPAAARRLGIAFQQPNLFPWRTVGENIALPLALLGVKRAERRRRAAELAATMGLAGFVDRWPRELSGGMQQRASLARALATGPDTLLLDEPFGALDALTRDALNVELQALWLRTGCTAVMVTHSIAEAVFLADRIAVLSPRPGRIDAILEVPLPRPRTPADEDLPAFREAVAGLRRRLAG